ncbi:MAG: cytochrome b/b6 domain-containing protein [Gluconobacter potus]|uniref:Cytochrome b n=1 Tax=Gluconobacter potus TaxID=2724927 RepID=A0ABR9YIM4_9PROT|nr:MULTISPECIES: cytochrome b/b6 domain-containing protein [Gluconobacter]MBF0852016.1 cytochrome b [Gluconobacter sp. R75690]MBF0863406.1 cytochrome b [Gluconobacter sp. R71656]MBF0866213.1 cytochrome b [Gluconobacter sp. R75628]MBF0872659.1 cytochrome b [Gluconobacter sp. R75629]MBF0880593.1 cytochrome b [Gluconobacter sp. R75828]
MNETDILRYDRYTIVLHWAVGFCVVLLWVMAEGAELLPKGPLRLSIWSVHVLTGFLLALLLLVRIAWRVTGGRRLPPAERGVSHMAAVFVHGLLYVLLIAVVGLGIANVFGHGFPLFGIWRFPRLWDRPVQHFIAGWHGTVANVIMIIVLIHVAAVAFHSLILKDHILRRMMPGSRRFPR